MKQFGQTVKGYDIPVLNEREIRGAAGILFLLMIISFLQIALAGNFLMIKYFIGIFMVDMMIRVFISPKYSPSMTIARFMTNKQTPQYVGAAQKKFAWYIGLTLSTAMFVHIVLLNAYGIITGLSCFVCLIFMFFELAFGICIGCKIYALFNKNEVKYCPGEVCEVKERHPIQETKITEWVVVFLAIGLIVLMFYLFNDTLAMAPHELKLW